MAVKILLVEDDKSLREIYGVRLQAEGYDIVSASDGEQALAVAIKERPSLIITDVMMPKISGFDMLDILRSTTETKDIKVIMMTALSSDDQRTRGERMGADRYLVKSQVGIEDVVRTVHEVLGDNGASATPAAAAPAATPTPAGAPAQPPAPAAQLPGAPADPATDPVVPAAPSVPAGPPAATTQPVAVPPSASAPVASQVPPALAAPVMPPTSLTTPSAPSARQKIIQPVSDINDKVDINELLDKELAKEAGLDMLGRPQVASTDQEKAVIQDQLNAVAATTAAPAADVATPDQPLAAAPAAEPAAPPAAPESAAPAPTSPAPQAPAARPATPTVPGRDTPLQAPPRIPTI